MALSLAERARLISPSATIAMAQKARDLKAQGRTIFDFTLGESDFDTPENVGRAAWRAIERGKTRYTPAAGIPELRDAVARLYRDRGLETTAKQVVISNGAKHALHNAFMALVNPGDEVIVPAPFWVSYADLIRLAGGVPIILNTSESDDFKLKPDAFRAAVTPRTRLLLLNSPCNPTGMVYSGEEQTALADAILETEVGVVSDEIYEQLIFDGTEPVCFATLRPGLADRVVTISGVSKSYAMTGWRIGWAVAPPAIAGFMADLQSQETSNPCSISQHAALEAITGPQDSVREMREEFARRRLYALERVAQLPDVTCRPPSGAFYLFLNVSAHYGRTLGERLVTNSTEFCMAALETAGVALVMGQAFGADHYVRLSYATDLETLSQGFDALADFLKK
jgi:aspartate aminotransferase